jgi:NAD(P)-dependent dehydrogenase (short-subunit alcohol dehydrogenase family)
MTILFIYSPLLFCCLFSRFAAYSASKAALNQAMRHMAAELKRKGDDTILLAIHPGEVATYVHVLEMEGFQLHMLTDSDRDMANIDLGWEVDGIMTAQESVSAMIKVIESKGIEDSGTFWTWENKVCQVRACEFVMYSDCRSNIPGKRLYVLVYSRIVCRVGYYGLEEEG